MDLNPVHRMTPKRKKLQLTEKTIKQFNNLYLDTRIGQLDCLSFIDGIGNYEQVKKASRIVEIENMKMHVLNLDALIQAKNVMKRPRDKEAILELESIKKMQKNKPNPKK